MPFKQPLYVRFGFMAYCFAIGLLQEEEECDFDDIRQLDHTCLMHFWDRENRYRYLQFGFEVSLNK